MVYCDFFKNSISILIGSRIIIQFGKSLSVGIIVLVLRLILGFWELSLPFCEGLSLPFFAANIRQNLDSGQ